MIGGGARGGVGSGGGDAYASDERSELRRIILSTGRVQVK